MRPPRLGRCRWCALLALALNLSVVWLVAWRWSSPDGDPARPRHDQRQQHKAAAGSPGGGARQRVGRLVTIVLRQFEQFENDVAPTVLSLARLAPNVRVVVIASERAPYPPLDFGNATLANVRVVSLALDLFANATDPLAAIDTKYALFVPDATRVASRSNLRRLVARAEESNPSPPDPQHQDALALAAPFARAPLSCLRLRLEPEEWTLRRERVERRAPECDAVAGRHALLVSTRLLRRLPRPLMRPFPEALYLQTAARGVKVRLVEDALFNEGKPLFRSQPARQRLRTLENARRAEAYRAVGIKRVFKENGAVEWHGCTRDTERCFPPVVGVPSYLTIGRWTPPCCLAHLRRTLRHAVSVLQQAGARCWLEGATLLGAVRKGDVLPWASHLEIGINEADVVRVPWLMRASNRGGAQDPQGFVWEKATRGDYYRVLFGRRNRLHVNVLPFRQRNGTMTARDAWFVEHQADFADHFLHPMSSIELGGVAMPCPNNVRDFLDRKFGRGIIERTKRPGSQLPYP